MIEFKPAIRMNTPIVLALAGASGSGKTKTALELAVGLAGSKGKIAVIDSEGRRALHYADDYKFDHGEWRPPFTPETLLAALKDVEGAGYAVIIVDSASDEYEGEGGLQDMAADDLKTQRGDGNSAAAWARPKAQHKLIIKWLRQCRCHVIFALRAEEKVKFEKRFNERKQREETVIVPIGWVPICEKRFMFDMTTSLLFTPDHPGVPLPIKLYEKHARFFPEGKQVTRAAGEALAAWANGGADMPVPVANGHDEEAMTGHQIGGLKRRAMGAAKKGTEEFRTFWAGLSKPEKDALRAVDDVSYLEIAKQADESAPTPLAQSPEAVAEVSHSPTAPPPGEPEEGAFGLKPDTRDVFVANVMQQITACDTLDGVDTVKRQWYPQAQTRLDETRWNELQKQVGDHETKLFREAQANG